MPQGRAKAALRPWPPVGGEEELSTPMFCVGTLRLRDSCPTAQSSKWQCRICPGPICGDLEPPGQDEPAKP